MTADDCDVWPPIGETLNDLGGNWERYVAGCYAKYRADFYESGMPAWPVAGQVLNLKRHPTDKNGWCNTFWHLTSEGAVEDERTPDLARLERISWPKLILDEFASIYPDQCSDRVCWWVTTRGREKRYLIALADFTYLVVVADRGSYVLLWTAFPVERSHRRTRLEKEYLAYWKANKKD